MKLGEALVLRSQLQTRLQQLRERLKASAVVQEGEKPPEDPAKLLRELDEVIEQLEMLIARINRTNLATTLPDGRTVTEALARRDVLALKRMTLQDLANVAGEQRQRYSRAEIRLESTVDVGALRAATDDLARERRELDVTIQETNWATEIAD